MNAIDLKTEIGTSFTPYYKYNRLIPGIDIRNDNWAFLLQAFVVDSIVGKQLLGTNFSREGSMGRFIHSLLSYQSKNITFGFGRAPIEWGQSRNHSIIQSGQTPPYDHVRFKLSMGNLSGELLAGQLGSEVSDSKRITRLIAGHKLTGYFFDDKLEFQVGEQIIYTGVNRNIEFFYLNPAIPYVFAVYDEDDLNVDGYNNDNGMIFINGRYNVRKNESILFEFIIDDYQIYNDPHQDMLGWKLGMDGNLSIANYTLNWESEYTKIDSWTYIHSGRGQFTTWQNRGHAIGYPYGGDLRSFRFQIDSWLKAYKVWLNMEYIWLEKGSNNIHTQSANSGTLSDPFPYPPVKVFYMFESSITYHTKFLSLQTGYTNIPFPYEIANGLIDELKGGLFFNLQLHIKFDIDMEQNQEE